MRKKSNLLLIGGSKQNVGKTTFIIDLLKNLSVDNNIIAIKTSCHFHGILPTDEVIVNNDKYTIVKETVTTTGKDSARMLEAGAKDVYFIQAKDEFIGDAFSELSNTFNQNDLIICETSALRKYIIPEIYLALVNDKKEELDENKIILNKADYFIEDYLNNKIKYTSLIDVDKNKWTINRL